MNDESKFEVSQKDEESITSIMTTSAIETAYVEKRNGC
jgi:hypothetical protein